MGKKSIWKSKLMNTGFWLAVFGALQAGLPAVKQSIPVDAYGWIFLAVGILVAGLRYVTTQPVK